MLVLGLFGLPAAYLIAIGALFLVNWRKGLIVSLVFFAVALLAGIWSMRQSPPIPGSPSNGLLLLPYVSTLGGVLGLAFAYGWKSTTISGRFGARLALLVFALLVSTLLISGKR